MSVKRRDKKNRVLKNGEHQRPDGRYEFIYTDKYGDKKHIYSWKLEETDSLPTGKRKCAALRTMEKEILRMVDDNISTDGGGYTVMTLAEKLRSLKVALKPTTLQKYDRYLIVLKGYKFSKMSIHKVTQSTAKDWIILLQQSGKSYETIKMYHNMSKQAFELAVEDDLIRKNPFNFPLGSVIVDNSESVEAITKEQMEDYLEFVRLDIFHSRIYDDIYILFHTGLRISELAGLTINDIDFDNKIIYVRRQLINIPGTKRLYVTVPKTSSGNRKVPMTDDVVNAFKRVLGRRKMMAEEPIVDGVKGFVFLSEYGTPKVADHWQSNFRRIWKDYSKTHPGVRKVTPHVCRHTFCSNMIAMGMNPRYVQYIMGHSKIEMTLNVYTSVDFDNIQAEFVKYS